MLATDEEIIFVVEDTTIVSTKVRVKFIAEVWLSSVSSAPFTQTKIATLKVTPNNAGSGIFDFSRILEAYVSPDYLGGETIVASAVQKYSQYNGFNYSDTQPHSIHQIDKHSLNRNVCKMFAVKFKVEYADSLTDPLVTSYDTPSDTYYIHNAARQEDDTLGIEIQTGRFGYNYHFNNYVLNSTDGKFLTNAPTTQYIGLADYQTIAYFNQSDAGVGQNTMLGKELGSTGNNRVRQINIQFYYGGSTTGGIISYYNDNNDGSVIWQEVSPKAQIQYTGVGTANIVGAGGSLPSNWEYYTVEAGSYTGTTISDTYYFYNQEVCKGFEKFRLAWLNRLGVWDYFNFTKRNVRKVNSKRETYQQIKGSWNDIKYIKHGYKGGTKTFSTNSKEIVTLQTDFITEEAAKWLEELFTSPDVFVLQERSTDLALSTTNPNSSVYNIVNKYTQPCIVTTSSYTRKTTANDKLKQYTIDIEMSHNKRIQKA